MSECKNQIYVKQIERTMEALKKNNMEPFYCETVEDAVKCVKELIRPGDVIASGGSETLKETGILDVIKSDKYSYLDRSAPGLSREQVEEIYRKAYLADVYFASSNAITENGELYNVDGNSNRVSAILYGPKSVVLVCGRNKIVRDIDEAVLRVKSLCAPSNTIRLDTKTYCEETGRCISFSNGTQQQMCSGCNSDGRVCCNYVVSAQQRHKNRIKVIIINEDLGY